MQSCLACLDSGDMAVNSPAIDGGEELWDNICTRDWKNNQISTTDLLIICC